jgi:hypothetical protein
LLLVLPLLLPTLLALLVLPMLLPFLLVSLLLVLLIPLLVYVRLWLLELLPLKFTFPSTVVQAKGRLASFMHTHTCRNLEWYQMSLKIILIIGVS